MRPVTPGEGSTGRADSGISRGTSNVCTAIHHPRRPHRRLRCPYQRATAGDEKLRLGSHQLIGRLPLGRPGRRHRGARSDHGTRGRGAGWSSPGRPVRPCPPETGAEPEGAPEPRPHTRGERPLEERPVQDERAPLPAHSGLVQPRPSHWACRSSADKTSNAKPLSSQPSALRFVVRRRKKAAVRDRPTAFQNALIGSTRAPACRRGSCAARSPGCNGPAHCRAARRRSRCCSGRSCRRSGSPS